MKKTVIFSFILIFTFSLFAQREETLISGRFRSGGYGGPVIKFTNINGKFGALVGGEGGWLIKQKEFSLILGGGGYGLVNNVEEVVLEQNLYYNLGYGGVLLGYVSRPHRLQHYSFTLLIGAGGLSFRDRRFDFDVDNTETDAFFVMEPCLKYILNITNNFRIGVGLSYRYISGLGLYENITNEDISGPSGVIIFKFGGF